MGEPNPKFYEKKIIKGKTYYQNKEENLHKVYRERGVCYEKLIVTDKKEIEKVERSKGIIIDDKSKKVYVAFNIGYKLPSNFSYNPTLYLEKEKRGKWKRKKKEVKE